MKRLIAVGIFLIGLAAALWLVYRQPAPVELTPSLSGETEYCLTCHADLPEISTSHPVDTFGCVSCHGGERLALNADLAHSTMRGGRNPSRLSVVEESCGGSECHSGTPEEDRDHIQRVVTSIQATYAGAIASVRYTFGAQESLAAEQGVYAVEDPETATGVLNLQAFDPEQETHPSILRFADNCLNCHISAEPLSGEEYHRETGCASCHTPASEGEGETHSLTTAIPYTQCNTCHNRGNYSLTDMKFHPREDQYTGRLFEYYQPIAQFVRCEYTLDCIDCHTRNEAMGDGDIYSSQAEIQYVECRTCHGTLDELPLHHNIKSKDELSFRMAALNPVLNLQVGDTILVTEQGEPLWNTRLLEDGSYELFGKAAGTRFTFNSVLGTDCEQDPAQQESRYCHECHAIER
jgi:hypothetical protein